ncbi:hypothetical protein M422DRAFT_24821 [Sphaerobolus stellatus SS14]|nr:hypothetical protein M422DRAFT_24821 [Sphaerobolus stellatus SS14]
MSLRGATHAAHDDGEHQRRRPRENTRMSPSFQSYDDFHDDASVEMPRHYSNSHVSLRSFEHPSHFDSELYSRHGDEDSMAMDPELGHTMSTAAHHASRLTLGAGLGGYEHSRFVDDSQAEFDPERPLQPLLNRRVAEGLSMFDTSTRSRSKSAKATEREQRSREPIILDPSVGLDRYLQTGRRPPSTVKSNKSYPYILKTRSQPDPGASDDSDDSPPRIAKALGSQFSPKRPRSTPATAQSFKLPPRPVNPTPSRAPPASSVSRQKQNKPTPGPSNLNPARHRRTQPEQENQRTTITTHAELTVEDPEHIIFDPEGDNEATPRAGSKMPFSTSTPTVTHSKRSLFANIINKDIGGSKEKSRSRSRVHLPDITGLSAAVETPVKGGTEYRSPDLRDRSFARDLVAALDALQKRLQTLEREHAISRRRVRELELDLEDCKIEADRERTRILNRERELGQDAQAYREREKLRQVQDKLKEEEQGRYRQIVEEKKSLESFVNTMRNHMTRLTSELALHQSLIEGLRADAHSTEEVEAEVQTLRGEVDRLAGEVERLKTFVEDGVRERQRAKEANSRVESEREEREYERDGQESAMPSQVGIDMTYVTNPLLQSQSQDHDQESVSQSQLEEQGQGYRQGGQYPGHSWSARFDESQSARDDGYGYGHEGYEDEPEPAPESLHEAAESEPEPDHDEEQRQEQEHDPEQDPESDYEPEPEPEPRPKTRRQRFIEDSELARVEAEMQERRSERSGSVASERSHQSLGRENDSGNGSSVREERQSLHENSSIRWTSRRAQPPQVTVRPASPAQHHIQRARSPAPQHQHERSRTPVPVQIHEEVPLPQVRGSRIERLFYSAPEHDAKSCPACMRQRMNSRNGNNDDDNGGYDDVQERLRDIGERFSPKPKGRRTGRAKFGSETAGGALGRVIRELEDDFTHYKGVYLDLADQYGIMDAISNVAKRNVLANHLRWIIDLLERIGDHIATLHRLGVFEDKSDYLQSGSNGVKMGGFV